MCVFDDSSRLCRFKVLRGTVEWPVTSVVLYKELNWHMKLICLVKLQRTSTMFSRNAILHLLCRTCFYVKIHIVHIKIHIVHVKITLKLT